MKEVATTIEALHRLGFVHQDVRLPNICFSRQFKPVLIYLDRMCIKDESLEYPNGAMHKPTFSPAQNDWMQLGLIILWMITGCYEEPESSYYDVKRWEVPQEYQSDNFVCSLMNGEYQEEQLTNSKLKVNKYNSKTLQSVLTQR